MKRNIIYLSIVGILTLGLTSCSGCVKDASKKVTELGISAIEGVTEAVDEHGERVAEKSADAAGKLAVGVGRSLSKQLDEHAATVASVAGKTLVQSVDGLATGLEGELNTYYDNIPYTEKNISGVSVEYLMKYKNKALVEAYFIMPEEGNYIAKFECYDTSGKLFLTKDIAIAKDDSKKYSQISFALNAVEEEAFKNIKEVTIAVTKK